MSKLKFPFSKALFEKREFSKEGFLKTIISISKFKAPFTGFLQIDKNDDTQYLMLFLKSKVYAAGAISQLRPANISIKYLFELISLIPNDMLSISLYNTDPVLLKGILVYIQKEPTIKVETNLIDLENIINRVTEEGKDAFIVLKKLNMMNFFFFKDGKAILSHYSDSDFIGDKNATVSENLLSYAYPTENIAVEAFIFRDIKTLPAEDSEGFKIEDVKKMLTKTKEDEIKSALPKKDKERYLDIDIIEGPQKGDKLKVSPPCIIGRKGVDVIIKDQKVSRKHASITDKKGKIIIEDLNSTNGTFVNKKRIKVTELHTGDIISIGDTKMKISIS